MNKENNFYSPVISSMTNITEFAMHTMEKTLSKDTKDKHKKTLTHFHADKRLSLAKEHLFFSKGITLINKMLLENWS